MWQIGAVPWLMMDRGGVVGLMGVVAVAGSDWFDDGCVCGSVDGLCVWLC